MRRPTSDMPENVTEKEIPEYRQEGMQVFFRLVQCILDGQAVSKRVYIKAAEQDETLPEVREIENFPERRFPVGV